MYLQKYSKFIKFWISAIIFFNFFFRRRESSMENPQNGVKNEEDMKNEEEDISKDDMEEATLDEEDMEEGMVEEGPKKLRARATANSSDVIRYVMKKLKQFK